MNQRLIFTITPGRSGTMLLSNLCALLPDTTSLHEPKPYFSDTYVRLKKVMLKSQDAINKAVFPFLKVKRQWIKRYKTPIYIETCHMACKGFFEPMLAAGWEFDCIYLTRPHREVATSLYKINDIPGITKTGKKYYLDPWDTENRIDISKSWERLTAYQLCYWYCLEMEKRAQGYFETLTPYGVRIIEVGMHELLTYEGFCGFLDRADLPLPYKHNVIYDILLGVHWNIKTTRKRCGLGPPVDPGKDEAQFLKTYLKGRN